MFGDNRKRSGTLDFTNQEDYKKSQKREITFQKVEIGFGIL